MFARITAALLAAALTSACASAEDAARWADEAAVGQASEELECAVCEYEEYTPRQAEAPAEAAVAEDRQPADDARGDERPDGIEEQTCSNNDLVWYEYCPQ